MLYPDILEQAYASLENCDLLLVVGTSAVVQVFSNA
jgi:NAD-dependent SIR2 family protein deacetylase